MGWDTLLPDLTSSSQTGTRPRTRAHPSTCKHDFKISAHQSAHRNARTDREKPMNASKHPPINGLICRMFVRAHARTALRPCRERLKNIIAETLNGCLPCLCVDLPCLCEKNLCGLIWHVFAKNSRTSNNPLRGPICRVFVKRTTTSKHPLHGVTCRVHVKTS